MERRDWGTQQAHYIIIIIMITIIGSYIVFLFVSLDFNILLISVIINTILASTRTTHTLLIFI